MMEQSRVVRPFHRSGSWIQFHRAHRRAAAGALWQLRRLHTRYRREFDAMIAAGDPRGLARHKLAGTREHGTALATAVEIYSTMSVEAFINFYGVVRLGEDFFRANLQMVGVTEKLSLLLALCDGVELERDSELWRTVRALFDRRNALVHPKARELRGFPELPPDSAHSRGGSKGQAPPPEPDLLESGMVAYRRMRTFYRLFSEYVPEVDPRGNPRPGLSLDPRWWPDGDLTPPEDLWGHLDS
ncbi:hypothetical protein [Longimicrobium sp.]|uniref:hypothetical protein n=1 Tax=Longimicrobium sp. TaxID=2029185 RepID=UPI002E3144A3|nr:hypothetical protein [Longimicrobium sp.]HEX6040528.1 hypothetical protein [Longimicrobium sp.]